MKRIPIILIQMTVVLALLSACGYSESRSRFTHRECNSMYYWKTEFKLDSVERDFLVKHDVQRLYIRFFDVVAENRRLVNFENPEVIPNATIRFTDSIPPTIIEVVPTVYITLDALKAMNSNEDDIAHKIVTRVNNMVSYNEIPKVSELQLDCDWTESTEESFFSLCRSVRAAMDSTFTLSCTIRLHQLRSAVPPVDYGVLMCYNTGSFRNPDCRNSILDFDDVKPYLKRRVNYRWHLDVAYPIYDWTLSYRDGEFNGIVRTDSAEYYSAQKEIQYIRDAKTNAMIDTITVEKRDRLRHEFSDPQTIMRVNELVESNVLHNQTSSSTILYHLDSHNLNNFTDDEINQIYTHSDH